VAAAWAGLDQLDPRCEGALQAQRQVTCRRRFLFLRRRGRAVCVFTFTPDQRLDLADGKPRSWPSGGQSFDDRVVLETEQSTRMAHG